MASQKSPVRPLSTVKEHYLPEHKSPQKKLPSSMQNPPANPNPPILTEETSMRIQKPEIKLFSSELIKKKLLKMPCFRHKNKFLDQVCVRENCSFERLLCSQCAISEETHLKEHRTNICELQTFVDEKVEELEGNKLETNILGCLERLSGMKKKLEEDQMSVQRDIERDFKAMVIELVSYMDQIMGDMVLKLRRFFEETRKTLETKEDEFKRMSLQLNTEQAYVFNDLGRFLEIIDTSKESQVNEFMRNFIRQKHSYPLQNDFDLASIKFESITQTLSLAKVYNRSVFNEFKTETLDKLHCSHFENNIFLDIPIINYLPISKPLLEDKEEENDFEYVGIGNFSKVDFAMRGGFNTEHFQGVNSVAVDRKRNILFTCGNDKTIKMWLFNEKPVFILLDSVVLSAPSLTIKVSQNRNLLLTSSGPEIHCFSYDPKANDHPIILQRTIQAHKKQVRCLEIFEERDSFVSLSQDMTLKVWNYNGENLQNFELSQEYKIISRGKNGLLALGSKTGFLWFCNMGDISKYKEKQVFKEAITSIAFLGTDRVSVGSTKGRLKVFSLDQIEKLIDIKDINKGSTIYSLLPFYNGGEYNILGVVSWGGELGVWELKEKKKISSYQHSAKMSTEKHHNSQGIGVLCGAKWVFLSGNDDKMVEVLEFAVKEK